MYGKGTRVRTIDWVEGKICIIDQTRLPTEKPVLHLETVEEVAEAISSLRVRGALALGVAEGSGSPSRRDGRGRTIGATHTPRTRRIRQSQDDLSIPTGRTALLEVLPARTSRSLCSFRKRR